MIKIAPAVAQAAAESGVAQRPIQDLNAYRDSLQGIVYASGNMMRPIFAMAKAATKKRVAYAKVRKSACCARCKSSPTRVSPGRTLIGRAAVIAAADQEVRAAP
jgi:malate dehydrogenase (oxaloacetate-decarboxylating)(NADP+)